MTRYIGTTAMGIRAPIIKAGDNLIDIVCDSVLKACENGNLKLQNKDVVSITESLLARAQGNYCDISDITEDLNRKYNKSIGLVFPITSRNRFSGIMKAVANTKKNITVFLSYPSDEVGNSLMDKQLLINNNLNVYSDILDEEKYRKLVGENSLHQFTGVDYIKLYKSYAVNDNIKIFLSNNPLDILKYTDEVLVANIHDRIYLKDLFLKNNVKTVYTLADIMSKPIGNSGYNSEYGLYGSNIASESRIKLFPRESQVFVEKLQKKFYEKTNILPEVMVYGDGAFKDPSGKIWELADPVVSPGYTSGLEGHPNEIKLKYIADTELANLKGEEAADAMKKKILAKQKDLTGKAASLGTTPRKITDLLGSLSDLISGSGDKGTPIVLIKGYFDNYADD